MSQTIYKINTDIVSTTMKDKPLIFISEEAINLKRDNDNLKSIIKEVREYINKNGIIDLNGYDLLEILDKVVEIIEEDKKIEPLNVKSFEETPFFASNGEIMAIKINEIIDYINKEKE